MKAKYFRFLVYISFVVFGLNLFSIGEATPVFPTKPITLLVSFGAGGTADLTARVIAKKASELLGEPVIVMNKTAGGGSEANAELYNSAPDGYKLAVCVTSHFSLAPFLRKVPYDPWKITQIMTYGIFPSAVAVKKDAPWKTFKELIEYIQKNPGEVKVATGGPDVLQTLVLQRLKYEEKLEFIITPFQGGVPAAASTLGGHTDVAVVAAEAFPHIRSGHMRGLATLNSERMLQFPDFPTLKELGYNISMESRLYICGPPGLPQEIVKKLEEVFRKAMDSEDFKKVTKTFDVIPLFEDGVKTDKNLRVEAAMTKAILIKIGRIKE